MIKMREIVQWAPKIWIIIPIVFIIGYIIRCVIYKKLMHIAIAIICLISYPIWYLSMYIMGYNHIKYAYIPIGIFKFFMPLFMILLVVSYTEEEHGDHRKWIKIYGGIFTVFLIIKMMKIIFYINF
ncbi:MAG: hypothetical protein N4A64_11505 [Marinisporobacter sp.]|nr:hypothetical protein [Marinisporobacter sp.]